MPVNTSGVTDAVDRLENAGHLDPVVHAVRKVVRSALRRQSVRDALHGVWLGHPLHPALTDIPIGSWTGAAVLDALPGAGPAASTLIATGCVGYVPTILAGWADWSELQDQQQRVGLVHAAGGAAAFSCYVASLAARARGCRLRGKAWAYTGFALVTATGYLGGHLAYRQAAGVNHAEAVPHVFPDGWHGIGVLEALPDGDLAHRSVDGIGLVVVRRGGHVDVLADACSHLAAPLSEGTFTAEEGQGCVVCPWHGSTFRLSDGAVVHGPATAPMPRFLTRVVDGTVEVSLPGAG
jgi:nitrite reductase/ring-hydroxylating ferredoxin subunit/uncharacterized membrane protein